MIAAPGGILVNLNLMCRGMLFKVLAVVGDLCQTIGFNIVQGKGQCHIPEPMVMTVGLTVGSNVDKLGPGALF